MMARTINMMLALGVLLTNMLFCLADYPCVCNYHVERKLFLTLDDTSKPFAYLYEFDCAEQIEIPLKDDSFYAVAFRHKVCYIKHDSAVVIQLCQGNPPAENAVPTSTTGSRTTMMTTITTDNFNTKPSSTDPTTQPPVTTTNNVTSTTITNFTTIQLSPSVQNITNTQLTHTTTSILHTTNSTAVTTPAYNQTTSTSTETNTTTTPSNTTTSLPQYSFNSTTSQSFPFTNTTSTTFTPFPTNSTSTMPYSSSSLNVSTTANLTSINFTSPPLTFPTLPFNSTVSKTTLSTTPSTTTTTTTTTPSTTATTTTTTPITSPTTTMTEVLTTVKSFDHGNLNLCPIHVRQSSVTYGTSLAQHGDYCYELFTKQQVTWPHGEAVCNEGHGHLAYIVNAGEQAFVESFIQHHLAKSLIWIGLHDSAYEKFFQWTSGAHIKYANLVPGYTENHDRHDVEDCFAIMSDTGKWDDFPCGENFPFEADAQKHNMICQFHTVKPPHLVG